MGKRVILNRSGKITNARPGADPVSTMNRPVLTLDAAQRRAEVAEKEVAVLADKSAKLRAAVEDIQQDNTQLSRDLEAAHKSHEKVAVALQAKVDKAEAQVEAAEKRTADAEEALAAAVADAAVAPEPVALPVEEPVVTAKKPAKKSSTKKSTPRRKKSSS